MKDNIHRYSNRNIGKTNAMIISMIEPLEKGENVCVSGCKYPKSIIDRLKEYGLDAKSKPMITTDQMKAVWIHDRFEPYISHFEAGEKRLTGYMFYLKN